MAEGVAYGEDPSGLEEDGKADEGSWCRTRWKGKRWVEGTEQSGGKL
jgi:hypothetical protein